MKDAEKILSVFTSYENTDKDIILANVNHYVMPIIGETADSRSDILQFITGKSYGFINTWLHCKTRPVKIPLVDLCKIAVATNCNVFIFFDTEKCSLDEANEKHDAIQENLTVKMDTFNDNQNEPKITKDSNKQEIVQDREEDKKTNEEIPKTEEVEQNQEKIEEPKNENQNNVSNNASKDEIKSLKQESNNQNQIEEKGRKETC